MTNHIEQLVRNKIISAFENDTIRELRDSYKSYVSGSVIAGANGTNMNEAYSKINPTRDPIDEPAYKAKIGWNRQYAAELMCEEYERLPLHPVVEFYFDILGREPDEEGLSYWMNRLEDGMTLPDIRIAFFQSDEYESKK